MADQASHRKQVVVLIHGLGAHWALMLPISAAVSKRGFIAKRYGYRSWFGSIEGHAAKFCRQIESLEQDDSVEKIHIVAHSMGAIVTRKMLEQRGPAPSKINRIVMLGPPNRGSPAARGLAFLVPFCKTLKQLSNDHASFVNRLPTSIKSDQIEVGIIAAQHDRVVPDCSSRLDDQADRITLFSGHNGLLIRPAALKQIVSFLVHGKFQSTATTSTASD